jgi:NADH-quinone oxidoreductase subunit N
MSAATKTAALVVLLRVLVTAFPDQSDIWTIAVAVLVCISLAWGNLAALAQRDLKRLLAYSSISQAGFMLMAVAADSELCTVLNARRDDQADPPLCRIAARERELHSAVTLESLRLGWSARSTGSRCGTFMLGMAGFPLTGGLFGKALRLLGGLRLGVLVAGWSVSPQLPSRSRTT